ncbi:McrBC 5-methylcytosine restriction system component [Amorphoplanes digitatis]|uniref:5-methylcytosine-specific restriction enzyme subunit McrC n=1 Tax=Actinoplanes digitatis TaxID=1868 RepID=A0A7W7MTA2_9ACTN|nr:restriction endonuclease [Actinoplanes digitatis]MBB4766176.1 5-methylcytosine-specific restriction enzyme subunit McrC [Actinoplanes digitatis]GID96602.1 McrBC 5-methylcytosine restriction system component [Actinoplanes digitatis]
MRRFVLDEYQTVAFGAGDAALAPLLAGTGLVATTLTVDGRLRLTATSKVGVLQFQAGADAVELRVRPKLPIDRLFWMLGHARDDQGWREEVADLEAVEDFVPALAVAFTAATSRALAPGVLQGYRVAEEALPTLRGRLREADQLRGRLGLAPPLEVRYDDYSVDIPENQVLLAAADQLRRTLGVPARARRGLHRIAQALAEVSRWTPGTAIPETAANRLNARYRPALRLARLVLARHGTEHHAGATRAAGFTFDLNTVYEDWLTAVLRAAVTARHGGTVVAQHPMNLDDTALVDMYPDITWWRHDACAGVVDAKYKRAGGNADLYQMLAYCTALGLAEGHLVYATGAPRREYRLVGSGVRVVTHGLNLAAPLPEVKSQVEAIADRLAAGA